MKQNINLFLRQKPIDILLSIKNHPKENYYIKISKTPNCAYTHTIHVLKKLENIGLVKIQKNKRVTNIELIEKGEGLVEYIIKLKKVLQ